METISIIDRGITYHIEQVEEGGYYAEVVGLPGCQTEGETLDETLRNIREALSLFLEVADDGHIEIPAEFRQLMAAAS